MGYACEHVHVYDVYNVYVHVQGTGICILLHPLYAQLFQDLATDLRESKQSLRQNRKLLCDKAV